MGYFEDWVGDIEARVKAIEKFLVLSPPAPIAAASREIDWEQSYWTDYDVRAAAASVEWRELENTPLPFPAAASGDNATTTDRATELGDRPRDLYAAASGDGDVALVERLGHPISVTAPFHETYDLFVAERAEALALITALQSQNVELNRELDGAVLSLVAQIETLESRVEAQRGELERLKYALERIANNGGCKVDADFARAALKETPND